MAKVVTARTRRGERRRSRSTTRTASSEIASVKVPQGGDLRRRVPARRQGPGRRRRRRHRPADQPRDRLGRQGVRPGARRAGTSRPATPRSPAVAPKQEEAVETETLPARARRSWRSRSSPRRSSSTNRFAYVQLLVTGRLDSGEPIDVTRMVEPKLSADDRRGLAVGAGPAHGRRQGDARRSALAGQTVEVPVTVLGREDRGRRSTSSTTSTRSSRGSAATRGPATARPQGKNGFKLSLRGYDPLFDVRALTDDQAARRVNLASPDDSLMLLKPTGAVPARRRPGHAAGRAVLRDHPRLDRRRREARPDDAARRQDRGLPRPTRSSSGSAPKQQIRVLATYADGEVRDVTREAFVESGNTEVATADRAGLMTVAPPRRGADPGPLRGGLCRDHADRHGRPHRLRLGAAAGLRQDRRAGRRQVAADEDPARPSLCTDAEFLRRVYLDLTGLPPTADDVRAFLADTRDSRVKRDELVDRLIGSPEFVEYWTNKWADLLQVNRKFLGVEGRGRVPQLDPRPGRRRTRRTTSSSARS